MIVWNVISFLSFLIMLLLWVWVFLISFVMCLVEFESIDLIWCFVCFVEKLLLFFDIRILVSVSCRGCEIY